MKKLILFLMMLLLIIPIVYALDMSNMMTVINQYTHMPDWIRGTNQTGEEFIFENLSIDNLKVDNLESNMDGAGYNITASWFFGYINWSNIQNKFVTAVDDIYIYMSGTTITLNETKLNNSIQDISSLLNVNSSNYWRTNTTNYLGSDLTGSDGIVNRALTTGGVTLIVVDNQFLHPTVDYTISSNTITFLNQIFDTQVITIWN